MSIITFEGVIDNGQVRLKDNVRLPDNTRVYVLVPDIQVEEVAHIYSPRLAHPEQAADFKLEVTEEASDASL
ncbi:MAG TPA: hypothetical protein VGE04_19395 [Chloroflexia bacterium]|jgi:hypothetical protein